MDFVFVHISYLKEKFVFGKGISDVIFFVVAFKIEVDEDKVTGVHELEVGVDDFSCFPAKFWLLYWFFGFFLDFLDRFIGRIFESCWRNFLDFAFIITISSWHLKIHIFFLRPLKLNAFFRHLLIFFLRQTFSFLIDLQETSLTLINIILIIIKIGLWT